MTRTRVYCHNLNITKHTLKTIRNTSSALASNEHRTELTNYARYSKKLKENVNKSSTKHTFKNIVPTPTAKFASLSDIRMEYRWYYSYLMDCPIAKLYSTLSLEIRRHS